MRYLDGEASGEQRERVDRQLAISEGHREELARLRALGSELRRVVPSLEPREASVWEFVREELQQRGRWSEPRRHRSN